MSERLARLAAPFGGFSKGAVVRLVSGHLPAPMAVTGPTSPLLRWAPPTLVDPILWTPTAADPVGVFPSDRDVRIVTPNVINWKDGLTVRGGRNVAWLGGEVRFDDVFFDDTQVNAAAKRNRGLYIQGNFDGSTQDRHVHVEGVKFHGTQLYEGINVDCYGDTQVTATFQNLWFGRINWRVPPWGGTHDGGDALQPWRGPLRLRVDRFVASESPYQAIFLQPRQFNYTLTGHELDPFDVYEFRNVQLVGVSGASSQLLAMSGDYPDSTQRRLYNVYVDPGNRTFAQSLKGEWSGVQQGVSPVEFVNPDTPGIAYVSPGYEL